MLNKSDIIEKTGKKANFTISETERCIDSFLTIIKEEIKNDISVQLLSFGTFSSKVQEAYIGRNPKNGENINVPKKNKIIFKPSKKFKDYIN